MITRTNYSTEINKIDLSKLAKEVLVAKEFFEDVTENGTNYELADIDEEVNEAVTLYFKALNNFLSQPTKSVAKSKPKKKKSSTRGNFRMDKAKEIFKRFQDDVVSDFEDHWTIDGGQLKSVKFSIIEIGKLHVNTKDHFKDFIDLYAEVLGRIEVEELDQEFSPESRVEWNERVKDYQKILDSGLLLLSTKKNKSPRKAIANKIIKSTPKKTKKVGRKKPRRLPQKPKPNTTNATKVEFVDLELKFIRRYVNMHGKEKTQNQIRLFLNSLQKAIVERRIRKTSRYAEQISKIQDDLIQLFTILKKGSRQVLLDPRRLEEYARLIGQQVERESIKLIKSFLSIQGKRVENRRVNNLLTRIKRALKNGKIHHTDRYIDQIKSIRLQLKSFLDKNRHGGFLLVSSKELNGLNGMVNFVPDREVKNTVMRSTDFMKLKFDKLNFQGRWLEFIGNPSPGFSTMIFGMPKTGKSYLMIEFAGYLARNHGSVLYVAKEEELDDTLQEKLKDTAVGHDELYVSDILPSDLSPYDFVFLDSVTKMRLKPDDLVRLGKRYPNISFVYVFQATKHGAFRGSNEFQHDVDVVIEVPKKGVATQYGRFNQGGMMKIFKD